MVDESREGHPLGPGGYPITAMTKADHAYRQLRHEILDGRLPPGATLDQESLAARLGVSTTPLREALRRLESEQLVISRVHRDTIVAPLSLETLRNVYVVRLSLDPLAASLAAELGSDAELRAMQRSLEEPSDGSVVDRLFHNRRVHRAVYRSCGNAVLVQVLDRLWDMSDRYRALTLQEDSVAASAADEHRAIVNAVTTRDPDLASRLMHEHVSRSFEKIRADEEFGRRSAGNGAAAIRSGTVPRGA